VFSALSQLESTRWEVQYATNTSLPTLSLSLFTEGGEVPVPRVSVVPVLSKMSWQ
jgi:hypothetical protein